MKRAGLVFAISQDIWDNRTNLVLPKPPYPWFVRGPRGGIYEAIGEIRMDSSNAYQDYFIRNEIAVNYKSESVRYLRPGTRRYRQALEALGAG